MTETHPVRTFLRVRRLELGGTVAFWLYVAWPLLRWDKVPAGFDTIAYSAPNVASTARAFRDIRFPQWDPSIFGGVQLFANAQTAVLNPLKLPFVFFDPLRAVALITAFHLLVLGIGMVVLVHRLGWRVPAGLVASVVILGSGMTQLKITGMEQLMVIALLPWLLAAIDLVLEAQSPHPRRAIGWLALATGLVLVAGHPQAMFVVAAIAAGWALSRLFVHRSYRALGRLALGAALGAMLGAIQQIPTLIALDGVADKDRRALDAISNHSYVIQLRNLPGAVLGDVASRFPDALSGTYEGSSFVGACAVALALYAIVAAFWYRRNRVATVIWLATALGAIALAPGQRSPIFRAAFDVVPFLRDARVPARWMAAVTFVLAVFAAQGTDLLVRRLLRPPILMISGGVVVVTGLILVLVRFEYPDEAVGGWLAFLLLVFGAACVATLGPRRVVALAAVALVVGVGLELGLATRGSPVYRVLQPADFASDPGAAVRFLERQPEKAYSQTEDRFSEPEYLIAALRPNVNATYSIPSIDGYDGSIQVRSEWADAMAAFTSGSFNSQLALRAQTAIPFDPELFARFGVRWVLMETRVVPASDSVPGWRGPVARDGTLEVFENPAYDGEGFVYHATRPVRNGRNGTTLRTLGNEQLRTVALVEPGGPRLSCTSRCQRDSASVERDRPERLVARTRSSAGGGLLVVTEQYAQGWRATVDGHDAELVKVDGDLLGVRVPPGAHTAVFTYRTPGLVPGSLLALVAVIMTVILLFDRWPVPAAARRRFARVVSREHDAEWLRG